MKILVVGYKGFIGSNIYDAMSCEDVVGITSGEELPDEKFDAVVNANGNSRKYWANQNPVEDFKASVLSVYAVVTKYPDARHVFISSLDAHYEYPYGRNKRIAEEVIKTFSAGCSILRCGSVIGPTMRKGTVFDIVNESPLFVTPDSTIQFITSSELASIASFFAKKGSHLGRGEIYNVAGVGSLTPEDLGNILGKKVKYQERQCLSRQEFNFDVGPLRSVYPVKTSKEYVEDFVRMQGG